MNLLQPETGQQLEGNNSRYLVGGTIQGQGKHGVSLWGTDEEGKKIFIKAIRLQADHDIQDLRGRIDRLSNKFRREYENAQRLRGITGIATVIDYGTFEIHINNNTVKLPFLIQEFVDGLTLNEYLERHSESNGCLAPERWLELAAAMIMTLDRVHSHEVVHGDIHPGNFLIKENLPVLIDFGQSIIRDVEEYGNEALHYTSDFTPPERSDKTRRPEWEEPSDVFSLGMTLYYLATGKTIPSAKIRKFTNPFQLRNEVLDTIEAVNPSFTRYNPALYHVIVQAIHNNPHERANALQMEVSIRAIAGKSLPDNRFDFDATKGRIRDIFDRLACVVEKPNPAIGGLLDNIVRNFRRRFIQAIDYKRIEITGDRHEIISQLIFFLSNLSKGDSYWTLTHPIFWMPYNLGRAGRFLDFTKALALRGVSIRRLFLASHFIDEVESKFEASLFKAHNKMTRQLGILGVNISPNFKDIGGLLTGVLFHKESDEVEMSVKSGYSIGLAEIGGTYYSINFASESPSSVIRRITIQRADRSKVREKLQLMENLFSKSLSIQDPKFEE